MCNYDDKPDIFIKVYFFYLIYLCVNIYINILCGKIGVKIVIIKRNLKLKNVIWPGKNFVNKVYNYRKICKKKFCSLFLKMYKIFNFSF